MKLIVQLTCGDIIGLKKIINNNNEIWIVQDFELAEGYIIEAKDEDDLIDKMIKKNLPKDATVTYYDTGMLNVTRKCYHTLTEFGDFQINFCYLCDTSLCDHIENGICCLSKENLSQQDTKIIINSMIEDRRLKLTKISIEDDKLFSFKFAHY